MNSFEVIIFVCATFISVTGVLGGDLDCPQICPDLLDPVCGTDGNEYAKFDNHCELNMFNCKRQRSTLSTYRNIDMDWCTTTELEGGLDSLSKNLKEFDTQCMKPCPMLLRPICASNGINRVTFSNDCEMEMFNCFQRAQRKEGWRLLRNSSC
ncbi:enhancer of split M1 protein isoform X2 [Episyrphus balteatus]|uniref:enhancer of split M1 protein isoform X2 n=1 Tax=Episyrphus balteatus TaxID=286459 RepID=UPI002485F877|nr:enhancer of split M1 protein isoform X2 [Episyrphus balteatus]